MKRRNRNRSRHLSNENLRHVTGGNAKELAAAAAAAAADGAAAVSEGSWLDACNPYADASCEIRELAPSPYTN
jgi:hypothetical protein